jgi:hypothetical protein
MLYLYWSFAALPAYAFFYGCWIAALTPQPLHPTEVCDLPPWPEIAPQSDPVASLPVPVRLAKVIELYPPRALAA